MQFKVALLDTSFWQIVACRNGHYSESGMHPLHRCTSELYGSGDVDRCIPQGDTNNPNAPSFQFKEGDDMADRPKTDDEPELNEKASTPQLDRLERLAQAAATAAQEKQWRARKSGMRQQEEPSEVRDMSHDAEARARAEEAIRQMMAKSHGKRRGG
ncbi:hypothetical protein [Microvirga lotononidis]|uniref:Uncharacterized protein n=1 Tax=Microvirga lotononidis TaxID=864069 RepID=I4Z367_9HYPH|nr:hypothetical protein [Microvirga lotononidis]EIM30659.1 hypothetical protein MicloDRAFT_00005620 [Microvirga lotononidis]WQO30367.1 hypothetical protein U0023_29355 [Microvirga lotononidis]